MTQTNRYLERGTWEHVIADGMNRFNPCCVYMFKNHKVSVAKKRSKMKMTPIFRGEGECKFRDCKNKCKFSMDGNYLVNVEISSKVKHHMLESHARPVRGNLRQTTRKLFEHGQKPYKHCLKKFQDTPTDVKIAGNFSNFGNTTRKFQQIASESRYQNRLDPEEFERLCKLRVRMDKEIEGQKFLVLYSTLQYGRRTLCTGQKMEYVYGTTWRDLALYTGMPRVVF